MPFWAKKIESLADLLPEQIRFIFSTFFHHKKEGMIPIDMQKDWQEILASTMATPVFQELESFVANAYQTTTVYPAKENLYHALSLTSFKDTRVVLLGQDPYHGPHQAHGLSFSIASSQAKFPPSLRNIFQELETDLSLHREKSNLSDWAEQGVLLLNTVLTVEAGKAGSHRGKGWEAFTDQIISLLNKKDSPLVFILWGKEAQNKSSLLTASQHHIIRSVHPSPLSAYRGFFGSRPFSRTNHFLVQNGTPPIQWA